METELFKKVAGRFKKEEFQSFLSEWGYFSAEDVESCYSEKKDISKRVTVTRLTQICQVSLRIPDGNIKKIILALFWTSLKNANLSGEMSVFTQVKDF